ncbi:helix-turn-helix transcriptional regulator [Actinoallomurus soli]|uniref:helix-turn-helix transcriptional regulator n=1 Tax=Actinoallomurus soli TaxID=2952535 RepID=UPI0020926FA2|nr:helix-turn-helix transcriptional regulator [Actinoallomurus soli]MCO5973297.1 helix-turn-helix transcriptional regulator [Actinoallomurus soli]
MFTAPDALSNARYELLDARSSHRCDVPQRPAAPWRIEDLAAQVGLCRATLARRFTALTGQPPMAYLTWWRMTTAARLLRESEMPLGAIARQVGYGSPYAFSHAFKRRFGLPPGLYRDREPAGRASPAPAGKTRAAS